MTKTVLEKIKHHKDIECIFIYLHGILFTFVITDVLLS